MGKFIKCISCTFLALIFLRTEALTVKKALESTPREETTKLPITKPQSKNGTPPRHHIPLPVELQSKSEDLRRVIAFCIGKRGGIEAVDSLSPLNTTEENERRNIIRQAILDCDQELQRLTAEEKQDPVLTSITEDIEAFRKKYGK